MKRILVFLLTICIALGLLSGCVQNEEQAADDTVQQTEEAAVQETEQAEEQVTEQPEITAMPFKLGYSGFVSADVMRDSFRPVEWAVQGAGGEIVQDYSVTSAETQITSIENLISKGCDIIICGNVFGEASLPQISKICQENEVYWALWDSTVTTPDIIEMLNNDPYYVGSTNEDQIAVGRVAGQALVDAGATKAIMFKYADGVATSDQRVEGAQQVFDENGVEVLMTIVAPNDLKKAMSDALIAYPEADAVFCNCGMAVPLVDAIKSAGRDIKFASVDFFEGLEMYLDEQSIIMTEGGHYVSGFAATLMAINAFYGTPLSEEKYEIVIPEFAVTTSEDYLSFKTYCQSDENRVYGEDDVKQFLKIYNPDLTVESFQQMINDTWNIDYIVEKFS